MRKTLNFSVVLKIPLTTGPRMNCLFFLECMSIQCCKSKARLSSRGIQNNENSMKPAPSAGKCTSLCEIKLPEKLLCTTGVAKLWCYPELLLTPSLTVSITEIYTDIRQCMLSSLLRFISNFELNGCFRYIFIGEDFHNWPLILWSAGDSWRGTFDSAMLTLYFLIATEFRRRPQTKTFTVSTLGSS